MDGWLGRGAKSRSVSVRGGCCLFLQLCSTSPKDGWIVELVIAASDKKGGMACLSIDMSPHPQCGGDSRLLVRPSQWLRPSAHMLSSAHLLVQMMSVKSYTL